MLTRKFFIKKPTLQVAQDLLGSILFRKIGRKIISGKIVETEAYIGPRDRAAHSYNGRRTKRSEIEYDIGGKVYIYMVYGMYWQLNFTTADVGKPECVLIRAAEPLNNNSGIVSKELIQLANGPGNLCKYFKLDKSFYGEELCKSPRLWLEKGEKISANRIIATSRIGIDYAGPYWAKRKWRFYIKNSKFVSRI